MRSMEVEEKMGRIAAANENRPPEDDIQQRAPPRAQTVRSEKNRMDRRGLRLARVWSRGKGIGIAHAATGSLRGL